MLSKLILAAFLLVIGFAMLVFGNHLLYIIYNWLGLPIAAINPIIIPIFGFCLMVLGFAILIFVVKQAGNAENSGGR